MGLDCICCEITHSKDVMSYDKYQMRDWAFTIPKCHKTSIESLFFQGCDETEFVAFSLMYANMYKDSQLTNKSRIIDINRTHKEHGIPLEPDDLIKVDGVEMKFSEVT